ncbi:trapp complex protein trs85 [Ophiostoma piceae UAMH 11346]|uniref:Trapp complex protein trs85 n=1 Tax=Ophiostoma piceae (strain UAMH 11346) TaxID=1262450 RepID=S3CCX7_OPHP1|nr:trapp complex protein trs85 [Ophiostoma piceae UAMH 11346]
MPSPDDASPPPESIQSLPPAASSVRLPKMRQTSAGQGPAGSGSALPLRTRPLPLSQSEASLPLRRGTPTNAASLYASTLTPPGSRSMSPVGLGRASSPSTRTMSLTSNTSSATAASGTAGASTIGTAPGSSSHAHPSLLPGAAFTRSLLDSPAADNPGDPLSLLLKAFVPHVAVYSSQDTDDLVREKGFSNGLWELLRPFGERMPGRVQVRDSNGAPRPWDDFSVRFVNFGDNVEAPESAQGIIQPPISPPPQLVNGRLVNPNGGSASDGEKTGSSADSTDASRSNATSVRIPLVEAIVEKHLTYAERAFSGVPATPHQHQLQQGNAAGLLDVGSTSPYYGLYLRRLLSGLPLACHETFAHPVACVIAISSRNPSPIQTFQELYRDISQGDRRLPPWVDGDFLRYYVLVHDEENGDIAQSMALFEKMKRSLGLHCHLLRLRSSQSAETDDDSLMLPRSDWMTAVEEYTDLSRSEAYEEAPPSDAGEGEGEGEDADDGFYDPTRYIFESDATAIRTFVRELVTQSLVPTMERSVSVWNDQVASKRKGLSGRFMSLSKRWGGFGGGNSNSGSGNRNSLGGGSGNSNSNYDAVHGYYNAEASEAVLRKLADYAFMLRDWKLAMSTYDILRADYNTDKAWKYHAAANEMCALSLLIMQPNLSSRTKLESINSMLEQGFYSYHTRCGNAYGATRIVALGLELQRLRGGPAVDDSVRWGTRLMEARLVGIIGDALLRERMAVCCATRAGRGSAGWGSWRRKSAFWSVLAAEAWVAQGKFIQAQRCLNEARKMYSMLQSDEGIDGFARARDFMLGLQSQIKQGLVVAGEAAAGADATSPPPPDATEAAAAAAVGAAATVKAASGEQDSADGAVTSTGVGQSATVAGQSAGEVDDVEEVVELLVDETSLKNARRRSRHDSLMGGSGAGQAGLETAPLRRLSPASEHRGESGEATADAQEKEAGFDQV